MPAIYEVVSTEDEVIEPYESEEEAKTRVEALNEAIIEGALQRLRPKAMTATVIIAGLVAIILSWITVGFQTFKAARANPIDSIQYE